MIVRKIQNLQFVVEMSDEELEHLGIITAVSDNLTVSTIEELIGYILSYAEQHWYDAVKEPKPDGNSSAN